MSNDAAVKDVQIELPKEECALDMEQRSQKRDAALKDAQTKLRWEECAGGMGQRPNRVAVKDVETRL